MKVFSDPFQKFQTFFSDMLRRIQLQRVVEGFPGLCQKVRNFRET